MDEFAIIERFFRPLARKTGGALGLQNDTAFFVPPKGQELVLTTDTLVEGVHFLSLENSETVAQRLLRVSLSDLAASGAKPIGYLLNLTGGRVAPSWLKGFSKGLAADQHRFGVSLYGGDTTSGSRTLTLSLTAFGTAPAGKRLTRGGARPGDLICVSGVIGDGLLGLAAAKAKKKTQSLRRYHLPEPRLALGRALLGVASASIDVSDGLVADVGHILEASKVGATLFLDRVPLSREGRLYAKSRTRRLLALGTGGDDYELAFTIPRKNAGRLSFISERLKLPLSVIGEVRAGRDLSVVHRGRAVPVKTSGYRHFT